ncbi:polysaccharide deacetylase family protein [uncultured Enterovirga sp.]|uniref:polysaccharide deacetylase family protein n=1 Tax=uncultured Enterovirga sp. TaxID=2026352 RepID=UPI0035CA6527
MTSVERGWSDSIDRKAWRFLARHVTTRPFTLSGPTAVASITFDDVPDSAAAVGAPVLKRAGVAGTFYVAAETCGEVDTHWRVASREQVRDLAAAGHEIGCHTAPHVNVQSLGAAALAAECERSAALLAEITGARPVNFAYPFGDLGIRQVRALAGRFHSCRTIYERLNAGTLDLAMVGAIGLFDRTMDRSRLERLIAEAAETRGWLVFYTHDVADEPTFMGTSPRLLTETLTLLARHDIPCLTMEDALRHHGLPGAGREASRVHGPVVPCAAR